MTQVVDLGRDLRSDLDTDNSSSASVSRSTCCVGASNAADRMHPLCV